MQAMTSKPRRRSEAIANLRKESVWIKTGVYGSKRICGSKPLNMNERSIIRSAIKRNPKYQIAYRLFAKLHLAYQIKEITLKKSRNTPHTPPRAVSAQTRQPSIISREDNTHRLQRGSWTKITSRPNWPAVFTLRRQN